MLKHAVGTSFPWKAAKPATWDIWAPSSQRAAAEALQWRPTPTEVQRPGVPPMPGISAPSASQKWGFLVGLCWHPKIHRNPKSRTSVGGNQQKPKLTGLGRTQLWVHEPEWRASREIQKGPTLVSGGWSCPNNNDQVKNGGFGVFTMQTPRILGFEVLLSKLFKTF